MLLENEYQIVNDNRVPELVKTIHYEYLNDDDMIITIEHIKSHIVEVKEIVDNKVYSIKTIWKDKDETTIKTYHYL